MTSSLKINAKCGVLLSVAMLLASNSQAFATQTTGSSFGFLPSLESTKGAALSTAKWSALAFIAISAFRLATRWGDRSEPRYDFDKIMAGEELPEQLYYVWDDGFVGHSGIKPYLMLNTDNSRTEHFNWCWPKGFLGWSHYYYKGIIKGAGTAIALLILAKVMADTTTTQANALERIVDECVKVAGKLPFTGGLNPTADLFLKAKQL